MDIVSVSSLLSSLKTATDIAKLIRESDVSLEKAETKLKLAELVSALADAKLEAAEIQQALVDRDKEIRRLADAAKLKADLRWEQPCYFLKNAQGGEDPYCQRCYDSEQKLSRLHTDGNGSFHCRVCKQTYKTAGRIAKDNSAMRDSLSTLNMGRGWMKY